MERIRWIAIAMLLVAGVGCPADEGDSNSTTDAGQQADAGDDMTVEGLNLSRVEPSSGNIEGGLVVTLSGTGFVDGATVTFGSNASPTVTFVDDTEMRAEVPAGDSEGAVAVTVENPDGDSDSIANGFTYTTEANPALGFCQLQAQSPVSATAGEPTMGLFAIVFAEGITQGAGQGGMIEGELGWGTGADYESFQFVDMTYNTDIDGLSPGDQANDEYGTPLTIQTAGTYRYVARFRLTSAPDSWLYCDLDGSDNDISEDQLGVIEVTEPAVPQIDFCQLQAQSPVSVETGENTDPIYAFVFSNGATNGAGQASGIVGELGFAPAGTDVANFTFSPMTYAGDIDGLNAGDQANDEYAATLNVGVAGEYRYVARFRLQSEPDQWTYCDLDGSDNGATPDQLGVLQVSDPPTPTLTFCQTRPAITNAVTGDSVTFEGVAFAAGITNSAGDGGLDAELWWGPAGTDPATWTDSTAATYDRDEDGLNPGDNANDIHSATVTAPAAGNYDVAYRFSIDGGTTWSWCDGDGSDGTASGYTVAEAATLNVATANLPDACIAQFPVLADRARSGDSLTFYGRVTEAGVTGMGAADPNVTANLLVGPAGSDPVANRAAFTVIPATYFTNATGLAPGQDEYSATWTVGAAGDYDFVWEFSVDGGANTALCDIDGNDANTGFEADKVGRVVSSSGANPPDQIDYCRTFQTNLSVLTTDPGPLATVEVFEAGLTENNGGANSADIEVEIGYGAVGTNPAVAYTWRAIDYERIRGGFPNNYEYEGQVYPDTNVPAVGSYQVLARARRTGETAWVYCDTDETTADFRLDATTSLTIATP
jgi:hypothetical protein